ncbi:hypothetical protein TanjilG_12576 [Lupinus angustifolius]|uniref:Uncharacterized protein n=1 Tax=Lupinus angustifolius TaxID=3871 RepID=A0A4P1QYR0_LUPAN|nr:PREDICTED: uncharacterized protein LOC109326232 [Lupinus angustifolius]XP_019414478.1 PREDICTED: uncharacterized protein LOC109326232 [Lupinus angustifolius]OIV97819.1 hypothetical protein TanjilG_12576 [Lupinus angustifolius]
MVKQTPNRNQRTKGFKLKQGFKILILMALCIWLLYQLKNSSSEKKPYEESSSKIFKMLKAGHEIKKFGRKALEPWIKKPYELIDDTEDSKGEEIEDLIDEEDKDENEDEDDMPKEIEDDNLLEDQGHNEGGKNTQATSENHYKENGASRVAMRGTQSTVVENVTI